MDPEEEGKVSLRNHQPRPFSVFSLLKLESMPSGWLDTMVCCKDGKSIMLPKLLVGLIFPELSSSTRYDSEPANVVILPDTDIREMENVLKWSSRSDSAGVDGGEGEDPLMMECWSILGHPEGESTIMDNPDSASSSILDLPQGGSSILDDPDGGSSILDNPDDRASLIPDRRQAEPLPTLQAKNQRTRQGKQRTSEPLVRQPKEDLANQRRNSYSGKIYPGDRPYKCSFCDKRFKQVGHVHHHERTHTGVFKYACQVCQKPFNQKSHLTEHLRTHTGERPYACQECGKTFSLSSGLKSHLRVHSGERMFACSYCNKMFNQRPNLRTHERLHTGDLRFMCAECGKCFNTRSNLNRHQCKVLRGLCQTPPVDLPASPTSNIVDLWQTDPPIS